MDRELKGVLAGLVIHHVAELIDHWDAVIIVEPRLEDVECEDAALVIAGWMRRLPGYDWDERLPQDDTPRHR